MSYGEAILRHLTRVDSSALRPVVDLIHPLSMNGHLFRPLWSSSSINSVAGPSRLSLTPARFLLPSFQSSTFASSASPSMVSRLFSTSTQMLHRAGMKRAAMQRFKYTKSTGTWKRTRGGHAHFNTKRPARFFHGLTPEVEVTRRSVVSCI
ncbi:hypothetical protein BD324DRAFT_117143 [Kockovaella imperatae]|uniref:Uncharacterized protein n=1 Tax=Kockovaella imperatae TaxID=4999 RepID=A0A1Y1UAM3_9TREE|nr:hypothetical protein BD324DRAFT_117143 [Kockovaella imperatae]ORX35080.1 hypothetical protein BD324DRAFT_117143 [Kockovaella imperatae]